MSRFYETTVSRDSLGQVDVGHDLFPYKFMAFFSNNEMSGRWIARFLIKANEAGLKGVRLEKVKITNEEGPNDQESMMTVLLTTDKHPKEEL